MYIRRFTYKHLKTCHINSLHSQYLHWTFYKFWSMYFHFHFFQWLFCYWRHRKYFWIYVRCVLERYYSVVYFTLKLLRHMQNFLIQHHQQKFKKSTYPISTCVFIDWQAVQQCLRNTMLESVFGRQVCRISVGFISMNRVIALCCFFFGKK